MTTVWDKKVIGTASWNFFDVTKVLLTESGEPLLEEGGTYIIINKDWRGQSINPTTWVKQ